MENYPKTYEEFDSMSSNSKISELDFYRQGYSSLLQLLETKTQEIHELHNKNSNLKSDNIEVNELNESLKEEIGNAVLKLEELTNKCATLQLKYETIHTEGEHLKQKVVELKKDKEKMVTINQIDELLNTKLAKLENNILKQLDSNVSVSKKFSEENSKNLIKEVKNPVIVKKPTEKTFEVECMELVKQCTEWWCPVHSDFKALVKLVKPTSYEDDLIIKRAKSRFAYWSKGNTVRCCTSDRKRSVAPKLYDIPSCWPTSMPGDIQKLTDNFNNLNC